MAILNVTSAPYNAGKGGDDTAAIQAAVNAAKVGDTVLVPAGTTCLVNSLANTTTLFYGSATGVSLKSGITFQVDGTIQSIPNTADHYVILLVQNVNGLVITGKGKIVGDRNAGSPVTRGTAGQWGFGVAIGTSENVTIDGGLTISQCFGDGLTAITVSNLVINDVVFDSNYRQNASLIDVNGVKITNCTFSNAGQSGLDMEPDLATYSILNVAVDHCDFVNCGTLFPVGVTKAHIGVGSGVGTFKGITIGNDNQFDIAEQPIFVSGNAGSGGTPAWAAALNRIFYEVLKADWYRFWGYPTSWSD